MDLRSQTMHQGDQLLVPYQWCLRTMGAELDVLQASMFTIIEEPEAFTLRFQGADDQQEWCVLRFSYDELLAHRTELEGRRPKRTILSSRAKCRPRGYQDMLRALGYELEQAHAYSILVDELEDGFFFTYQYLDPSKGYVPRKRMVRVDQGRWELMVREAYARRGHPPKRKPW